MRKGQRLVSRRLPLVPLRYFTFGKVGVEQVLGNHALGIDKRSVEAIADRKIRSWPGILRLGSENAFHPQLFASSR